MVLHPNIKVNLGLDILRKRPDGFHDIETLFLPCDDFHDCLEVLPADEPSALIHDVLSRVSTLRNSASASGSGSASASGFTPDSTSATDSACIPISDPSIASGSDSTPTSACAPNFVSDSDLSSDAAWRQAISEDGKVMITIFRAEGVDWDPLKDLCVKAYRLLDADFNLPSVKIVLEKFSPVGAGLGGGSADAAYTLLALNELFSLGLTQSQLASYAARLGSDCAFFIYNKPMFGSGRGEILEEYPMDDFASRYVVRCYIPEGIAVSTGQAYAGVTPCEPEISLRERLAEPVELWRDSLFNAFEPGIVRLHPSLTSLKEKIYADGAIYASMSGSGSAFFGIFPR
jgi:4-diphosphocytidyl-2-C-methyl-D-erythritol kinase